MIELILFALLAGRQLINLLNAVVVRYLIKTYLSIGGQPLPMTSWFKLDYLKTFGIAQFGSIGIIASFTLVTFPLGIWIYSYSAGVFFPIMAMTDAAFSMITVPLNLFIFNKTLNEIKFNQNTSIGIILIEIAFVVLITGWFFVYVGNNGGAK